MPSHRLKGLRIACFYPWAPFEPVGSWARYTCLWRYLLSEGAQVTLAFLDRGPEAQLQHLSATYLSERGAIHNIGEHARRLLAQNPQSELRHFSSAELNFLLMYEPGLYRQDATLVTRLDALVTNHDVVTCEYPLHAPLLADFCRAHAKPLIVTCHDLLYELHGVHPGARERLRQAELRALALAQGLIFTHPAEAATLSASGLSGITVLTTGDAHLADGPGLDEARAAVRASQKIRTADYCLFVGSSHQPNIDAAQELRRLAKTFKKLTFVVAGSCHSKLSEDNFIATGVVTDQLLDLLYRGAVAVVVPLARGTGMSVKSFQALAYAKPVVATAVGVRGLPVVDGEHALIVASAADTVNGLKRLLADDGLRTRLAANARALALRLDFRNLFAPVADLILGLTRQPGAPSDPPAPSLFLIDNHLSDRIGHHYNYALSLAQACAAAGFRFRAAIHRDAPPDITAALQARGLFTRKLHEPAPSNPYPPEWTDLHGRYEFLASNDQFATELEQALTGQAAVGEVVFLPNATAGQILGLALLLHRKPLFRTLDYVVIVRYSLHTIAGPLAARQSTWDEPLAERYRTALARLMEVSGPGRIRLATDSAGLAKDYAPFWQGLIEVLPIPHTMAPHAAARPEGIPPRSPGRLRFVFLGDAREEKGFELLPAVLHAYSSGHYAERVEFVLQAFISSPYHQRMGRVIEEIERSGARNVTLLKRALSSADYDSLLQTADFVLLPYDAATYAARTSGPFIEAICADKAVIVSRHTWMSDLLDGSDAGLLFQSGHAADLVRAVGLAIDHAPSHQAAARELGKRFRAWHNPGTFLRAVMGHPSEPSASVG